MLSERDTELAHPEAFDFVFGNLPRDKRAEFNRHLTGCRYCQNVIDEYSEVGGIIMSLPPHVEPSADLEDRTVASMVTALAERRAAKPARAPATEDETATRLYPIPRPQQLVEPEAQPAVQPLVKNDTRFSPTPVDQPAPAETPARPMVTRLPVWRRYRGRLTAVIATAAAVIAAIVVPLSLAGGVATTATAVIPLHVTTTAKLHGYGAANGRATARRDASGSWTISLTVAHLKDFGDSQWYTCWYVSRNGQVTSAGTFQVRGSGNWTFSMTSAADPHDFRTMEITLGPPSKNGELAGQVILSGQTL